MIICHSCKSKCGRYEDCLQCMKCLSFFHIACVGIAVPEFDEIRRSDRQKDWACSQCAADEPPCALQSGSVGSAESSSPADVDVSQPSTHGAMRPESSGGTPDIHSLLKGVLSELINLKSSHEREIKELKDTVSQLNNVVIKQNTELTEIKKLLRSSRGVVVPDGASQTPTFASVAKNTSVVLIKPKAGGQKNSQTKSDLLKHANPASENLCLSRVDRVRDGGILVGCNSDSETSRLKTLVTSKLANGYSIKELSTPKPRIRIAGMSEDFEHEILSNYLRRQNPDIFSDDSICDILKVFRIKSNAGVFQAVVQVDCSTFDKVIRAGRLFVGYDRCSAYEANDIRRCFRCSGFGHSSKSCKAKTACPRCSLEHDVKNCPADSDLKCINCLGLRGRRTDINVNHAAWSRDCPFYKHKLALHKSVVFGQQ